MSKPSEVEINCIFLRETANAVLIEADGEEMWIPLSQVSEMHKGKASKIIMSQWIANQKGLI